MSKSILLVEDEESMQILLSYMLESKGFNVTVVDNGADAVSILKSQTFDILCTDIMLPQMNGIEVCKFSREFNPQLPIIVISSKSQEKEIDEALSAGANDYIKKPFDVDDLLLKIQHYLQ